MWMYIFLCKFIFLFNVLITTLKFYETEIYGNNLLEKKYAVRLEKNH